MNLTSSKNWKTVKLGDIASKMFSGGTPSTKNDGFYGGDIPWLRTQEVNFNYIYDTDIKITKEGLEGSSARWVPANAVIVAMYGNSAGRVAYSTIPLTTNQACCNIVANPEKLDSKFLYFALLKDYIKLENMATGGAQQNLSVTVLKDYEIKIPDLTEQRSIADILGSLDDKIELLRAQNKTLEAMAQAMFKEWFVDFRFPGATGKMIESEMGMIPDGWKVGKLTDIAEFLNGVASQKYPAENKNESLPVIKIREMKSGITADTDRATSKIDSAYIVKSGDMLFSWSGSLDIVLWNDVDGVLNQHLFKVTSQNYPKWFYYYWVLQNLPEFKSIAESKATTMGHIQRHHLDDAKVVIPDEKTFGLMDDSMAPLLDKQILNNSEIKKLAQMRDSLLNEIFSN